MNQQFIFIPSPNHWFILTYIFVFVTALPTSILNTAPGNAAASAVVAKKTLDEFEATKKPQEVVPGDVIDGNHPNLTGKLTHEQIDTSFNVSRRPTKRVKKILPPYHSHRDNFETEKQKAKEEMDKKPFGEKKSEPLSPAVVEELTVTEIRHAVAADINSDSHDKPPRGAGNAALNKELQKEATVGETQPDENENRTVFKEQPDNVTEKNAFALENSIQGINMQSTASVIKVETETLRTNASNDTDLVFEGDSSPATKLADVTVSTLYRDEPLDSQIHGIRLVPDDPHIPTPRSMWDLIREQQVSLSEEKLHDINNAIYPEPRALPYQEMQTSKPPFANFDAESAEVEYEAENFQHGLSNIEKHELPFSFALPWEQGKDTEFDAEDNGKEADSKKFEGDDGKGLPHSARFAAVSSNEELRIPADMARSLQLSEVAELGENVKLVVQSEAEPMGRTKWYILILTGNSTIVQRRRTDFTKYLRLNLAARLSVEYDDVKVNNVLLAPPRILVNVSVYAPSDDVAEESQLDLKEKFEEKGEGSLHKLAESNATLLELSGEEYHVVRFLSLQAPLQAAPPGPVAAAQRDEPHLTALSSSRHEDIEYVIYTFLGSACACAVLLTLFLALNKYFKKWKQWEWRWKREKNERVRLPQETDKHCTIPPAVIYSGGFPQIRGSWMSGGLPAPSEPPTTSASNASLLQRYPGIELTASQPASPRHNKLRMFNCRPDRVLVRKLPDNFGDVKSSTTQGQENLNLSN